MIANIKISINDESRFCAKIKLCCLNRSKPKTSVICTVKSSAEKIKHYFRRERAGQNQLAGSDLSARHYQSFKTARLQEAIKFDGELAIVRGTVHQGEDINRVLQVACRATQKP
jgi:hypothetical protein